MSKGSAKNRTPWFSETICRGSMRAAILSSSFGAISVGLMRDSSIIVLYATMLGAGKFLALFTTAVQPLSLFVLILPTAYLMEYTGKKRIMVPALYIAVVAYLGVALAGFAPLQGKWLMLLCLSFFAAMMSIYTAGWMPLLRGVVPSGEKGRFFGRQRTMVQIVITTFLVFTVLMIGKDASLFTLQLIFAGGAFLVLGRLFYMAKIPEIPATNTAISLAGNLRGVIGNRPLVHFSVYLFLLYLLAYSSTPVAFVFTKLELKSPDNFLVLLTVCVSTGSICGYFLAGRICDRYSIRVLLLISQGIFGLLNLLFLTIHRYSPQNAIALAGILFLYGGVKAFVFVCASAGIFSLLKLDNINTSVAIWYAIQAAGSSLSRIISGIVLDSALLPETVTVNGFVFTKFHVLFALVGTFLLIGLFAMTVFRRAAPQTWTAEIEVE